MATQVTFNGVTYSVPAVNEEDWQSLSNYLIALASASPSGGAVSSNIRVSTSATTAVATSDYAIAINYTSGAATVNLPAGVAKQIFIITDASGTAATNNITINRNGSNTIFGDTSYVLTHNNQSVIIGFSGGNWYRLAESIPGAVEGPASSVVGGVAAFNNTTGDRLQDLGVGTSGQVLKTDGTTPFFGMVVNANVDPTAAIAYSKLALTNSIVNADISSGAAIAYSKLNLTGTIVNADISASAAIAYSKLNLTASITNSDIFGAAAIAYSKLNLSGSIVNADINASAGIVYSKLDLTGGIVNADVNASAAIDYSKLNLVGGIVDADINASAAIARSKIAAGSASHVVVNDGSGNLSSVATLPVSQGGTGLNALGSALQVLRVDSLGTSLEFATLAAGSGDVVGPASSVTNGIVQFASTTGKALKDLGVGTANTVLRTDGTTPNFGTITNAYIDASAAIAYSKMESLTALRALVTNGSGALITHPNTTADEIGYLFGVSSNIQTQLNAKLNLSGGTLTGALTINTASNQLVLGSGVNALTLNGATAAAARTYTVPDVGTSADFVLTAGAQTIAGAKTFSDEAIFGATVATGGNQVTINSGVNGFPVTSGTTQTAGALRLRGGDNGVIDFGVNSAFGAWLQATDLSGLNNVYPLLLNPNGGKVGIGTSSPTAARLQVENIALSTSVGDIAIVAGNNGSSLLYFGDSDNRNIANLRYDHGAGVFNLQSAQSGSNLTLLSATNAGAVTLGASGAGSLSHVINGSNVTQQSATFAQFQIDSAGGTDALLLFSESGGTVGQWAIGKDNSNSDALDISAGSTLGSNSVGIITRAGAWTLGPPVVGGVNGVAHFVNTGDQGSTISISPANAGKIQICNASSTTALPIIAGTSNDTGSASGLLLAGYTNDSNILGDMLFDIRDNGNTAHATTTNPAYVFRSFTTTIMRATRAGAWTVGPNPSATGASQALLGAVGPQILFRNDAADDTRSTLVISRASTENGNEQYVNFYEGGTSATSPGSAGGGIRRNAGDTAYEFFNASDERLKDISGEYYGALAIVSGIPVKTYKWKKAEKRKDNDTFGFIAQDVQKLLPNSVGVSEDGMLNLGRSQMFDVLWSAVRELKAEVDQIKVK